MREIASLLQSPADGALETKDCFDELTVADILDNGVDFTQHPELILHLSACSRCRDQVTSVARALRHPSVAAEIDHAAFPSELRVTRSWRFVGLGALTAVAAAAAFMVAGPLAGKRASRPLVSVTNAQTHREPGMTTTTAPSLIAPIGALAAADTFRWTSVPRADRYRLTVFDRDGIVVWEADVGDTAIAWPDSIPGRRGTTYLWKVEARTGWDRWVASEMVEFSLPDKGRIP